jgi:hypothetical protein
MAGRKILISYKYGDTNVQALPNFTGPYELTTARHYVDALQALLDYTDHINKGEKDEESIGRIQGRHDREQAEGKNLRQHDDDRPAVAEHERLRLRRGRPVDYLGDRDVLARINP